MSVPVDSIPNPPDLEETLAQVKIESRKQRLHESRICFPP